MDLVVTSPFGNLFVCLVDSLGESNGVMFSVENSVIELHEGVSEDEHILIVMSSDSQRHDGDSALLLRCLERSPVVRGQVEVFAVNHKGHLRLLEFISLLARPVALEVFIIVLLELLNGPAGVAHQRSSGVRRDSASSLLAETEGLSINLDILEFDGEEDGMGNLMPGEGVLDKTVRVVETESDFRRLLLSVVREEERE